MMGPLILPSFRRKGITLVETMVGIASGLVIAAAMMSALVTIQKSIFATNQYVAGITNGARLVDAVAQDLRRAVRVGTINSSGVYTTGRNLNNFSVTETSTLAINIPDFYASNTPDNGQASTYKTTRYPRALSSPIPAGRTDLNTGTAYNSNTTTILNGTIPYSEAVVTVNGSETVRFAPTSAGTGEIQIRYYRGTRSTGDKTVCYFRAEYPSDSNTAISTPKEIAERVSDSSSTTTLIVSGFNVGSTSGMLYRVQSSFTPRFRINNTATTGTDQYVIVSLRNARRD